MSYDHQYPEDPIELPMQRRRAPLLELVVALTAGACAMTLWGLDQKKGLLDLAAVARQSPDTDTNTSAPDRFTPEREWIPVAHGPILAGASATIKRMRRQCSKSHVGET